MARAETSLDVVIEPVEQKLIVLTPGSDDEVLAARIDTSEIYLPVKPICTALGVSWTTQYRKIKADDVLLESTRTLRLQTRGGPQNLVCLDVEAIPLWLAGIEPTRVREDLRERLKAYKRWVRKVVYEAFARETGIETAMGAAEAMTPANPNMTSLAHIAQMAEAIATMARQQTGSVNCSLQALVPPWAAERAAAGTTTAMCVGARFTGPRQASRDGVPQGLRRSQWKRPCRQFVGAQKSWDWGQGHGARGRPARTDRIHDGGSHAHEAAAGSCGRAARAPRRPRPSARLRQFTDRASANGLRVACRYALDGAAGRDY